MIRFWDFTAHLCRRAGELDRSALIGGTMAGPFNYDARQQAAFEALAKMGACIGEYDQEWIHVEMTPYFGGVAMGDPELARVVEYVNQIGNVRNLDLSETAITDVSVSELGRLRNLVFLCLNGTSVSDRVLPFIRRIAGLKELVLSGTAVTDAAVVELAQMRELTFLQLYDTRMSGNAIDDLKALLPGAGLPHFEGRDSLENL